MDKLTENPIKWFYETCARSVPGRAVGKISEWCAKYLNLPGSAKSKTFRPEITPWNIPVMDGIDDPRRRLTVFVKPIQTGGSVIGEGVLCYWLATKSGGDIQYNWQNDEQSMARWEKRFERILQACEPVMARAPKERHKWTKGQILFPQCNFIMQGVFTNRNVASDSIKYQVNEEVHDEEGWTPGRLGQAFGRVTAYWDSSRVIISNAGRKKSELHEAFLSGTQQQWEVKCPGCGLYHEMHTEWNDKRPDLGGLRYDADGCRRGEFEYDYNKLEATVRFQMPCGYAVHDKDTVTRRALSLSGRYGSPHNPGAPESIASYTLEAVSIDYIRWLELIMEKHKALKALRHGNIEPLKTYWRERECRFASDEDRPFYGTVIISETTVKTREGLRKKYPDLIIVRFGSLDRQQGSLAKGEFPHYWGVIRDVVVLPDGRIHSLLVFEGKIETDEQAAAVMKDHEVQPTSVVVDSGDDTVHVYKFCLRYGFHAIKGGKDALYPHDGGNRKIYSVMRPLHVMLNAPPKFEYVPYNGELVPDSREPMYWLYSKSGIRDRFAWLSGGGGGQVIFETPGDVSQDYKAHMESEELQQKRNKNTGEMQSVWVQLKERNDLRVCECYIGMLMEIGGMIGGEVTVPESDVKPSEQPNQAPD